SSQPTLMLKAKVMIAPTASRKTLAPIPMAVLSDFAPHGGFVDGVPQGTQAKPFLSYGHFVPPLTTVDRHAQQRSARARTLGPVRRPALELWPGAVGLARGCRRKR